MPVDYQQIYEKIREIGAGLQQHQAALQSAQEQARELLFKYASDLDFLRSRVEAAKTADPNVRCALPVDEPLTFAGPAPAPPQAATLIASDGSQIFPDRNASLYYGVINVGAIIIALNSGSAPVIKTISELFYGDELENRKLAGEAAISLQRDLKERSFVEELAQDLEGPIINFTDGTIEIWGAKDADDPKAYDDAVKAYLAILSRLQSRRIPTAGYVDRPRADLLVRLLELVGVPRDLKNLRDYHPLRGVRDLWMFGDANQDFQLLQPGARSAVFQLQSGSEKYYKGTLSLHFFYVNVSESERHPQIARVEVPQWVAADKAILGSIHAALIEQCRVMGSRPYPYLLGRAHEIAVVKQDEKQQIEQMLSMEIRKQGQSVGGPNNKQTAKDSLASARKRYGK